MLMFFCGLLACASTNSQKEYALAQIALLSAKKAKANKRSHRSYSKALSFYKKALALYKKQQYNEASLAFEESLKWSEKAEFNARLKTLKESE